MASNQSITTQDDEDQMCAACRSMKDNFKSADFDPEVGTYLLRNEYHESQQDNNHLLEWPSLGRTEDIRQRSKVCSLCAAIINCIESHVSRDIQALLETYHAYYWRLFMSIHGAVGPRTTDWRRTKHIRRIGIKSVRVFPDGSETAGRDIRYLDSGRSQPGGVDLEGIAQLVELPVPIVSQDVQWEGSDNTSDVLRPFGRIYPAKCDGRLFKRWLRDCDFGHGCVCKTDPTTSIVPHRLIDVRNRYIVDTGILKDINTIRYITLSYVWGPFQHYCCLLKSNLNELEQEGGLSQFNVPQTMLDAMALVTELDEKYLWIDALCIIQDDPDDFRQQIAVMRDIYSNAHVTIVAGSGVDVHRGLGGVSSPRNIVQRIVMLGYEHLALLFSSQPLDVSIQYRIPFEQWAGRGWTLQERLLSRRCLVFTEKQAFWLCRETWLCEESRLETDSRFSHEALPLSPFFLRPSQPSDPKFHISSNGHALKLHIREYTSRRLTLDEDVLNAFVGILDFYEKEVGLHSLWGIPIPDFEVNLYWYTAESEIQQRNTALFPSWSWLAWQHKITFFTTEDQQYPCISCFTWHQNGNGSGLVTHVGSEQPAKDQYRHGEYIQKHRQVAASDIPESSISLLRETFHLLFWSSVAVFKLGGVKECKGIFFTEIFPVSHNIVYDSRGIDTWNMGTKAVISSELSPGAIGACFGRLTQIGGEPVQDTVCEFVLLGSCSGAPHNFPRKIEEPEPRRKYSASNTYHQLVIMLVSKHANKSFSRREAMAYIQEKAWVEASPVSDLVILG